MSWMWAFNGFLLGAYVLIFSKFNELMLASASNAGSVLTVPSGGLLLSQILPIFLWIIPVLGVVLCLSVWHAISAAMDQIHELKAFWMRRLAQEAFGRKCALEEEEKRHPRLIGVSHPKFNHDKMISRVLPGTMTITWMAVILVPSLASGLWELIVAFMLLLVGVVAYYFGTKRRRRNSLALRIERLSVEDRAKVEELIYLKEQAQEANKGETHNTAAQPDGQRTDVRRPHG
jgi:cytochrome c-type biogenesis protein CcmH/NrfF